MNSIVLVDMRPSDALVLAVIFNVTIVVSNDVLRALTETHPMEGAGAS
jgi:bifunctional DNase/RNase